MDLSQIWLDLQDHSQFILNALLAALLSWLLSLYYVKYGRAVGNRSRFAHNFMLLALTTMLIIYIVKSSIALSLGLVGALSIVRFRAAIKDPEELTYLFLVIGIGLGMGANQGLITILAFVLIMALLVLRNSTTPSGTTSVDNQMVFNVSSKVLKEVDINSILSDTFSGIELKRMSQHDGELRMSFILEADSIEQLSQVKSRLLDADASVHVSFIDNKNLAS